RSRAGNVRNSLGAGREAASLAKPLQKPADGESGNRSHEAVHNGRERPPDDEKRIAQPRAKAVHDPSSPCKHNSVRKQEEKLEARKLLVGDVDSMTQSGYDDGQGLTVEIAESESRTQRKRDTPAQVCNWKPLRTARRHQRSPGIC